MSLHKKNPQSKLPKVNLNEDKIELKLRSIYLKS